MERYLSIKKAADYLGVSVSTVNRMIETGILNPSKTPGGHKRFYVEELDEYLKTSVNIVSSQAPYEHKHTQTTLDGTKIKNKIEEKDETEKDNAEGTYDPRNTLNDLTGKEWMPETKSYTFQKGLGASHPEAQIEKLHPAPFSFQDISKLVLFFTKKGQTVLDPFGGVGSTIKACAINERKGIQIELTKKWHDLAIKRIETECNKNESANHTFINGDTIEIIKTLDENSIDFIVTSPPYWGILNKKPDHKVMERVELNLDTNYSDDEKDLGNISDYSEFLQVLVNQVFIPCGRVLKDKKYMCIIVSDFRDKNKYISFHSDLIQMLNGSRIDDKFILALQGDKALIQNHKSLKPYGYPFAYVENIHHQHILIFRKMKG